jgi:hypothetical protein
VVKADGRQDEGPQLAPWPGGGNKGRALPASGILAPVWAGSKDGYARLTRMDRSNLRVVRYFWPWFDIKGPVEPNFANGKPFNQLLLAAPDFANMGIDWPGLSAGHTVDAARICASPEMSTDEAKAAAWTISPLSGVDKYTSGEFTSERMGQPLLVPDKSKAYMRASFTLTGKQSFDASGRDRRSVSRTMSCPLFSYDDKKPRSLKVHLWMSLYATRNLTACRNFHMGARVTVKMKTPQGELELYDSETSKSGKLDLWDAGRETSPLPQSRDEPVLAFTIPAGKTGKLEQYSLVVVAQVSHNGYCPNASADVQCTIKEFSVSWV